MIHYKYNLKKDIKNSIWTFNDRQWFKEHSDIVVFWPNPLRWLWLLFWIVFAKKPKIESTKDITCYFVSAGTWGAYHPEDMSISICPWKINESPDGNMKGVIHHEIVHLEHPEADSWDHAKKEAYIEKLTIKLE